jgi:rhamnosyltransferase subunit B
MSWRRALWRFVEKGWIDPVAITQLNAVRSPLGLSKVHSFLTHITEAPDFSVTLFPSWFAPTVPDWPRPLIEGDFQLFEVAAQGGFSEELSAFLAAGEKPLVFTPGTGNLHATDFFACAVSAVNQIGRRAIFLTRERRQIPARLPESILWQPYVPLSVLLPHAAVLVHHGGIGTTAEALPSDYGLASWREVSRICTPLKPFVLSARYLRHVSYHLMSQLAFAEKSSALCRQHAMTPNIPIHRTSGKLRLPPSGDF